MIRAHGITKSFGKQVLFDDVSFAIHENEKVGLVGRNGHGKSTLLKMITGEIWPDRGEIMVKNGKILESVNQHIHFTQGTVREEACLGLREGEKKHDWLAAKLLWGLGFDEKAQNMPPESFSGGFQVRINLAKALLSRPDIMLLDEPTNYLDITSLRWLEGFLRDWKGTFMLVTHDRTFMEKVVTSTMSIHRGKIKKTEGGPAKLAKQIGHEEEIHEKTRKNQEKKDAKTMEFIKNFRSGARSAGLVQSRIKMIAKKDKIEVLKPLKPISFRFNEADFAADKIIKANRLKFHYAEVENQENPPQSPFTKGEEIQNDELLHSLSLEIRPGDKIGIVGPNGRGKSTLLEVLAKKLAPKGGTVKHNVEAKVGYFRQMHHGLKDPEKTVYETLRGISASHTDQDIHKLCGSLMFEGDKRHKPMKVLSGGERSRVNLGKLMLLPHNVLLLDEPTNHLDMESCAALANALNEYNGAVVCVTHDEALLKSFAEKLVVFDGGKVGHFRGDYGLFLKNKGWIEAEQANISATGKPKDEQKENRYKIEKEIRKKVRPIQKKIDKMEEEVLKIDEKLQAVEANMQTAQNRGDVLQIGDLAITIGKLNEEIEAKMTQMGTWETMIVEIKNG